MTVCVCVRCGRMQVQESAEAEDAAALARAAVRRYNPPATGSKESYTLLKARPPLCIAPIHRPLPPPSAAASSLNARSRCTNQITLSVLTRAHFPPYSPVSVHLPPSPGGQFYNLSADLANACLKGFSDAEIDFPFRVSPAELEIINMRPTKPPTGMLLVGRSGTGKTTCALYRIYFAWEAARSAAEPFHQIFITASATLRQQVESSFRKLQNSVRAPEDAAAQAAAAAVPLRSFEVVSEECARPSLLPPSSPLLHISRRAFMLFIHHSGPVRVSALPSAPPQPLAALPHVRGVPPPSGRIHAGAALGAPGAAGPGRRCGPSPRIRTPADTHRGPIPKASAKASACRGC